MSETTENLGRAPLEQRQLQPKFATPQDGRSFRTFDHTMRVLLSAEETAGSIAVYEDVVPPGSGVAVHMQTREEEFFFVLEGQFEFMVGERIAVVEPGTLVFVPRDTKHAFKNIGTKEGRLLTWNTPGGHERFLEELGETAHSDGHTEESLAAVSRKHGVVFFP